MKHINIKFLFRWFISMIHHPLRVSFLLILISCVNTKSKDPLKDVGIGLVSMNEFESSMLKQGIISEGTEHSFRYYIVMKKDSIPVELHVNPDYRYFGYFGKLREIELNLGADTVYLGNNPIYRRGEAPRNQYDLERILQVYTEWYGKPDSIINPSDNIFIRALSDRSKTVYIWNTDHYTLTFNLYRKYKNDSIESRTKAFNRIRKSSIIYRMKGYQQELAIIEDSIRQHANPNDILNFWRITYKWIINETNHNISRLTIYVNQPGRKDYDLTRDVIGIKFDLLIKDEFDDELCRINDWHYSEDGIMANDRNYMGPRSVELRQRVLYIDYDIRDPRNADIENARMYSNTGRLKLEAYITALSFSDGSILKK